MARSRRPGPDAAAHYESLSREYRRIAQLVLDQEGSRIAAGALIYEAAKQCINAVANLQSINPVATGAKRRFLINLANAESTSSELLLNWRAAELLHINADRDNISEQEFGDAWERVQAFIVQMLQICARDG